MALLQRLRANGLFVMVFASPVRLCLQTTIFLDYGLYQKISARYQVLLSHRKCSISCMNIFIMGTGQYTINNTQTEINLTF